MDKTLPKPFAVVQRAAEEHDLALDPASLRQTADGLVDDRLIDRGGDIGFGGALVDQRLDIRLGEYAAARGDGVDLLMFQAQRVHFAVAEVQQGRHLVDESAGAARAGAVHTLIESAGKEDDLRVLAAQLDHRVGIRLQGTHALGGGIDLLHKAQGGGVRHAQSRRAGDRDRKGSVFQPVLDRLDHLQRFLPYLREVALIAAVDQLSVVDQRDLGGSGADVDAQQQRVFCSVFQVVDYHILPRFT